MIYFTTFLENTTSIQNNSTVTRGMYENKKIISKLISGDKWIFEFKKINSYKLY